MSGLEKVAGEKILGIGPAQCSSGDSRRHFGRAEVGGPTSERLSFICDRTRAEKRRFFGIWKGFPVSHQTTSLTSRLYEYFLRVGLREAPVLRRLREETHRRFPAEARMQIAPEQGAFMAILVELIGARRALEAGVFTGYSALAVALALPREGLLIACDTSTEWTSIGQPYWKEAGVLDRIDLRTAPALETMDGLLADGQGGTFDFIFLDADKAEYLDYYGRALALLRPGGLCVIDNVLWGGLTADPKAKDPDTLAIRALNEAVHGDESVSVAMVPIADGLTLARKRV